MIKEENNKYCKQQGQLKRNSNMKSSLIKFSSDTKQQARNQILGNHNNNVQLSSSKGMKSFKRFGTKAVIAPYTGLISDENQGYSIDSKCKSSKKENLLGGEKKKLKRIGKKVWVSAFKQTIDDKEQKKKVQSKKEKGRKQPQNEFTQFQQNILKQDKAKIIKQIDSPDQLSEVQSLFGDDVLNEKQKNMSIDKDKQFLIVKAESEVQQTSVNCSWMRLEESPVHSEVDQTLESMVQKTQFYLQDDQTQIDKSSQPIQYHTYSISVNSQDQSQSNIKIASKRRDSSNMRLQELLIKAIEKRPSVLKNSIKKKQTNPLPKRSSIQKKQQQNSIQNHTFLSICSEQNSITKNQNLNKNYKPLPESQPFADKKLKKTSNLTGINGEKKGVSQYHKRGGPLFKAKRMDSPNGLDNSNENLCSMVMPFISKIEEMRFVEPKQVIKYKSMHNSTHLSNENKSYSKNTDKGGMGSSLKRNYKQFEMSRYIQQAKEQLKHGGYN